MAVEKTLGADMRMSRRNALIGGTAAGVLLLPTLARAQKNAGLIRTFARPRRLENVDHSVVYRREDEFCAWPHTSGFWNMGNGELLQNFIAIPTVYESAGAISHDKLGTGRQGKMVTVRSKDFGRTWDGARPTVDGYARIAKGAAGGRSNEALLRLLAARLA